MTFTSFEPTRNVQDFHLAAFAYYDGLGCNRPTQARNTCSASRRTFKPT